MTDIHAFRLARQVVLMFTALSVADTVVSEINAVLQWQFSGMLKNALAGGERSVEDEQQNYQNQKSIWLSRLGVRIAMSICFLVWIARANKNARLLGAADLEFWPGMCVASFFIPIVNLFWPYKAVREIWQASHPDYGKDWCRMPVSPIVGWWWALWLINRFLGAIAYAIERRATDASDWFTVARLSCFLDLLEVPTVVLVFVMVRRVQSMQERRFKAQCAYQAVVPETATQDPG